MTVTYHQRFKTPLERFGEKYEVHPTTGCWIWTAAKSRQGYGRFAHEGGQLAHRFSFQELVGPIPEGLTIDHLCRTPLCVNPWHLEAVTGAENTRRGSRSTNRHCPRGHLYDLVKVSKRTGWVNRRCSVCDRDYFRARYQRERAAGIR